MRVIENKILMFRAKKWQRIVEVIPQSRKLEDVEGGAVVAVNLTLDNVRVLRNLGVRKAPSPIRHKYKWPGLFTPYKHQIETAEFLTLNKRCYCLDEQGLGKTAAAAWAADYLLNLGVIKRVLVICPLSIMETAWQADMFRTIMHRRVEICYGDRRKREAILANGAEIVVTNFDSVKNTAKAFGAAGFDLIIIDEVSNLKNAETDRWKAINSLVKPNVWVWGMTGTPAAQSPMDAYGVVKLITPDRAPRNAFLFKDMVMTKVTKFKWVPKATAKQTVIDMMQPAIRHTKEQCLDLPPIVYMERFVEMTKQQKAFYEQMRKSCLIQLKGTEVKAVNKAVLISKLIQTSMGAVLSSDKDIVEFDIKHRFDELMEIVEQAEAKLIVFTPFKAVIPMLVEQLQAKGIATEVVTGDVSVKERVRIFQKYQNEDADALRIIVAQPNCMSHGVTLTRASDIVWWAPTSSVEVYEQANARAHRNGVRHSVNVHHMLASPAERHAFDMLMGKRTEHKGVTSLFDEIMGEAA